MTFVPQTVACVQQELQEGKSGRLSRQRETIVAQLLSVRLRQDVAAEKSDAL